MKCENLLRNNQCLYAVKAERKKIALIRLELKNDNSQEMAISFGSATLNAGGRSFPAERPEIILKRLSEFTWDFLLYLVLDFHPALALIDLFFLVTGPLYNRRLKKQLGGLVGGDVLLQAGEQRTFILGFTGVSKPVGKVIVPYRCATGETRQLEGAVA